MRISWELPALAAYPEPASWFDQRDQIKALLAAHLVTRPTQAWLDVLEPADIWCASVLDRDALMEQGQFRRDLSQHRLPHPHRRAEADLAPGPNGLGAPGARIVEDYGLR